MPAKKSADTSEREIVTVRVLDAPRDLVFEAWTDPEHLKNWWGPVGFSTTTLKMDFRQGGTWKLIMHGPDGRDYPNQVTYKEIVRPEYISWAHSGDGGTVEFHSSVTFKEISGKTEVTMRAIFATAEDRNFVVKEYNAAEGGKQTIGRLAEHVERMQASAKCEPFVISREFKAPIDLMWKVWTEPEHMKNWWGPKGAKVKKAEMELRPGGTYHYGMSVPGMGEMYGKFYFREIEKPTRLVYLNSFSDEKGGVGRHPMAANWPLFLKTTITFAESKGITTVRIEWQPFNATEEEIKAFAAARPSMNQGWGGTLEQLNDYLANQV